MVLYTNHLPKVGASDDGIWRRLVVIPFKEKIKGKSDIKNYADYLVTHAGSYILRWIIEGAGLEEKSGELYQVYRAYSIQNGEYTRGTHDFYAALDLAGYHRSRHKGGVVVHGITLKKGHRLMRM